MSVMIYFLYVRASLAFLCLFTTLESSAEVEMAEDRTPILAEGPLATL